MWTIHGHDSFENSKGENAKCCPPLPQALSIKGDVTLGIPQFRPLVGNGDALVSNGLQQVRWCRTRHWKVPCPPE